MLNRGLRRLMRFASSNSASASVWVVMTSIDAVSETMRRNRSDSRPIWVYDNTRRFRLRALPT